MLKGCPRCKGDMLVDYDEDGWYAKCMQCSCRAELKDTTKFSESREGKETEARET